MGDFFFHAVVWIMAHLLFLGIYLSGEPVFI